MSLNGFRCFFNVFNHPLTSQISWAPPELSRQSLTVSSSSKMCPNMSWNLPLCLELSPKCLRLSQNCPQMVSYALLILWTIPKRLGAFYRLFQDVSIFLQIVQNVSNKTKLWEILKLLSNCPKVSQTVPKLFKNPFHWYQTVTDCSTDCLEQSQPVPACCQIVPKQFQKKCRLPPNVSCSPILTQTITEYLTLLQKCLNLASKCPSLSTDYP